MGYETSRVKRGTNMGAVPFSPVETSPGSVTLVQTGANLWQYEFAY